ncbi:MAG: hypothetical protein NC218_11125 [Acetobacter sp.]|nr:hypothetical protein [Acetobacter sp.]
MSSVFKKPKVKNIAPEEVSPNYVVEDLETARDMERRRQRRTGALSQFLSRDNSYGNKTRLGD